MEDIVQQIEKLPPNFPQPKNVYQQISWLIVLIVLMFLFALFFITYFLFYKNSSKNHIKIASFSQKNVPTQTEGENIYTSPIGVSFTYPQSIKISEYDFSHYCNIENYPINPSAYPTTASSAATFISLGDSYNPTLEITIIKMNYVGTVILNGLCAPGDLGPYRLLIKNDTLFSDVQNLINNNITASQSKNFNDMGISDRYNVILYKNSESQIIGISNFQIYGFAVPGLSLYREYFLHDSKSKYIIYVRYPIVCPQLDAFEKQQDSLNEKTFNDEAYLRKLHQIAPSCNQDSPSNKVAETFLASVTFLQ